MVCGAQSEAALQEAIRRIRAEYRDMPGLNLSSAQGARLWGLNIALCEKALTACVQQRLLYLATDGTYRKA